MLRSAKRCALIRGPFIVVGPGSAKHHFALHRVRDTGALKYSINTAGVFEMASVPKER
jgi:hypothetical protein